MAQAYANLEVYSVDGKLVKAPSQAGATLTLTANLKLSVRVDAVNPSKTYISLRDYVMMSAELNLKPAKQVPKISSQQLYSDYVASSKRKGK